MRDRRTASSNSQCRFLKFELSVLEMDYQAHAPNTKTGISNVRCIHCFDARKSPKCDLRGGQAAFGHIGERTPQPKAGFSNRFSERLRMANAGLILLAYLNKKQHTKDQCDNCIIDSSRFCGAVKLLTKKRLENQTTKACTSHGPAGISTNKKKQL